MGANFQAYSFSTDDTDVVKSKWKGMVTGSLYEDGHDPYSGGIGTLGEGIDWHLEEIFPSRPAADDYIEDNHEKWGPPIGVRYRDEAGDLCMVVGGWCAE